MGLTSKMLVSATASLVNALDLGGEARASLSKGYTNDLAAGVAAGQADKVYWDEGTIAASGTLDVDLSLLLDPLGVALGMARVKGLIVYAGPSSGVANTNNVIVGNAAATQFLSWVGAATHTVTLRPGATLALMTGPADAVGYVAGAGAKLLRLANSGAGTAVAYQIFVIGASA